MWYDEQVMTKEKKVVVKLRNKDGSFKKSCIVPSATYPLSGAYEIFHCKNTELITDENILSVFNSVEYKIGKCYTNTEQLLSALSAKGIEAKSYVGWLFVSAHEYPIHHCWVVVNGKSILDLSDDYTVMLSGKNGANFQNINNVQEERQLLADFQTEAKKYPNSVRCYPVGIPTNFFYYVGCECDSNKGRSMYQQLMKEYPNHEAERNVDRNGYNKTQSLFRDLGLMG